MKEPLQPDDDRIPVKPYWVGDSLLDYCVKQGWMSKEREGRSTRYYCTPGVALSQATISAARRARR